MMNPTQHHPAGGPYWPRTSAREGDLLRAVVRPTGGALALTVAALLFSSCTAGNSGDTSREAAEPSQPVAALSRVAPHRSVDLNRPIVVGFLVVDGVYNSELMAPYDIFHHTPFHTVEQPGMEVFTVSPEGRPVTTFEGLVLHPHHSFETAPAIDVLVVPSAEHSMDTDLENSVMINWVREVGQNATFVVSLCDGAFVLATAGLLDSRAVTTFPGDQDRFAEQFPNLDLRRNVSFVHDGPVLTSEGGAKSYDVAMYLVDHLWGPEVTRGVGGGLLIDWPPKVGSMPHLTIGESSTAVGEP